MGIQVKCAHLSPRLSLAFPFERASATVYGLPTTREPPTELRMRPRLRNVSEALGRRDVCDSAGHHLPCPVIAPHVRPVRAVAVLRSEVLSALHSFPEPASPFSPLRGATPVPQSNQPPPTAPGEWRPPPGPHHSDYLRIHHFLCLPSSSFYGALTRGEGRNVPKCFCKKFFR